MQEEQFNKSQTKDMMTLFYSTDCWGGGRGEYQSMGVHSSPKVFHCHEESGGALLVISCEQESEKPN